MTTAIRWLLGSILALPVLPIGLNPTTSSFRGDPRHSGVFPAAAGPALTRVRWSFQTAGPIRGSAALASGRVFVGSADGRVYAVELSSGRRLWSADLGGAVSSTPAVSGGTVFAASRNRRLTALDAGSGAVRWRFDFGPELPFQWGWDYWVSSPVVAGSRVFVGAGDGGLYALEASTGRRIWRLSTGGRIRSSPAVADGVVYVGSMDGKLYAVDAESGMTRYVFETEGSSLDSAKEGYDRNSITSSPAVSPDGVYFGSRDGHLYGIALRGGTRRWRFGHRVEFAPGAPEVGWVVGSPALTSGLVLVGSSDGKFFNAVRETSGEEVWRFRTPERVFSSGAVSGDSVFFGCDDGHLFALDAKTGAERWRFSTGAGTMIVSSPIVTDDGTILFGSDDGRLWALQTGPPRSGARTRRAVFWTEPGAWKWFEGDAATRDYFAREGYEVLDPPGLLRVLSDTERARVSTIVMASDRLPAEAADGAENGMLRRYLAAGGRMIWLGLPPDSVGFDPQTGKPTGFDASRTERLLGVSQAGGNGDRLPVAATPEGRRWGVPDWWIGGLTVPAEAVSAVLGKDETGRASAWVKTYGAPADSGFVSLWSRPEAIPDLSWVKSVAEHAE